MIKAPERVEVPEHHEMRERFARVLAILIVVATLGVATVEYLHSVADGNADHAGVEAQKLGIERQGELVRANDAARTQIEGFAVSEEQRTRSGNAFQQFLLPSVTSGSAQAQLLQLEETRWSTLADLTGQLTDIKPTGNTSPVVDPAFPNLELTSKQHESDRLFALQDASNQLRGDWQTRVGLLSVILTMFAVAIYLFGLSLTLQARVRRLLVGLGLALVAVGGVWTVALQFGSPAGAPEQAAEEYANGVAAEHSFYTQSGDTGLRAADAAFTKAIELRPTFASAYVQRSLVRFLLGSPQRDQAVVSVTTLPALQAQGNDLQKAYELGNRDKLLLNDLAANRLLYAIEDNHPDAYATAIGYLEQALRLDSGDPLLYYNEGLAYLGQGNTDKARAAYQLAVDHTLYTDVAQHIKRNDVSTEESYVGGALTPLDLLVQHRHDLGDQARAMKELVVGGVDHASSTGPQGQVKVSNATVQVFAGELQWTANVDGYNPSSDQLSTQWYYQGQAKLGWSVLSAISGIGSPAVDGNGTGSNPYYLITRYLAATSQCLQPGSYRVEVYANGHLVGSAAKEATLPALAAASMPEVGAAVCHPPDWKQDNTNVLRGFSNGLINADRSAGVYVLRFQNPSVPAGTDPGVESKSFRDQFFGLSGFLPAGVTPQLVQETSAPYFLGLAGANEAYYSYGDSTLRIGSGVTKDGSVLIGVAFGPSAQWSGDHSLGDTIFDSMISLGG